MPILNNLIYIAEHQFLVFFHFLNILMGKFLSLNYFRHWSHDGSILSMPEYCMKTMMWHGGGGLDLYLDTKEFQERARGSDLC